MAEMLVRTVDKTNPDDVYKDVKCSKRGDVIEVKPDGWPWGVDELKASFWTIIKIPGVDPSDLQTYLKSELDTYDPNASKMLRRRAFKFDLDAAQAHLSPTDQSPYAEKDRMPDALLPDLQTAQSLKVTKPALADPNVIG